MHFLEAEAEEMIQLRWRIWTLIFPAPVQYFEGSAKKNTHKNPLFRR